MATVVLLVVLAIVAVGLVVFGRSRRLKLAGAAAGAVLVVTLFLSTFVIVKGFEVGVPVTFGKVGSTSLKSGPHFVAPWTEVETYPKRPIPIVDPSGEGHSIGVTSRTSQGGQVTVQVGGRWQVIEDQARELYLQTRSGDEDAISRQTVQPLLATAAGNVISLLDNQTAVSGRVEIEQKVLAELQRLVADYGISVTNITLSASEPDAKTADAIARIAAQERETTIAQEAENTVRQQATNRRIEAQGLRDAAARLGDVTPAQVYALCVQAWERQQAAAIAAGQTLNAQPCGGSSAVVTSSAK